MPGLGAHAVSQAETAVLSLAHEEEPDDEQRDDPPDQVHCVPPPIEFAPLFDIPVWRILQASNRACLLEREAGLEPATFSLHGDAIILSYSPRRRFQSYSNDRTGRMPGRAAPSSHA